MVFQRPNPFPKSIYDNVAYGLRILGMKDDLDGRVEQALKRRRALGRGEEPPEEVGARPLRRPAAAALHRPRDRGRARRDPARRAGVGARPDLDVGDRGPDARAEARLHARDRHAQHAAGRARRRDDGVLQPRRAATTARATASSSSTTRPRRSSRSRPTSGPRATSRDASADEDHRSPRSSRQLEAGAAGGGRPRPARAALVAERARARRRGARRRGDQLRRRGRHAATSRSRQACSRCSRGRRRSPPTCGSCSRSSASTSTSSGWRTTASRSPS